MTRRAYRFAADKLRRLREDTGLSQSEFGTESLGVGRSTYRSWESGRSVPNAEALMEIASALGVEPAVLFTTRKTKGIRGYGRND